MATPVTSSNPAPTRWERLKAAVREINEAGSKKSTSEIVKDQFTFSTHFVKGVGKSALQIIESGIRTHPAVMSVQQLQGSITELKKMTTDFEGWNAERKAEWESGKKILEQGLQGAIYIHRHPLEITKLNSELIQDFATDKSIEYIQASPAKQGEVLGVIGGHVGLTWLGGELMEGALATSRLTQAVATVERNAAFGLETFSGVSAFERSTETLLNASQKLSNLESGLATSLTKGLPRIHPLELEVVSQVPQNPMMHKLYKRELREWMEKPVVRDSNLADIVEENFRKEAVIGNGSTSASIRFERATGLPVKEKFHSQKGLNQITHIEKWLRNNPHALSSDRAAAENLLLDIRDSLR